MSIFDTWRTRRGPTLADLMSGLGGPGLGLGGIGSSPFLRAQQMDPLIHAQAQQEAILAQYAADARRREMQAMAEPPKEAPKEHNRDSNS